MSEEKEFIKTSIIVPCFNEQQVVSKTITELVSVVESMENSDLIAVNDGSIDKTGEILEELAARYKVLNVLHNDRNRGYGAAIKKGIRATDSDLIAVIDADLTYPPIMLPELIARCRTKDMVVGVRPKGGTEHNSLQSIPKFVFRKFIQWMVKANVPDFNSGLRVFRRELAVKYLSILPDGFSFTTTITIALHQQFYQVQYIPTAYNRRLGKSKISPIKDTIRFFILMIRTGIYFSPLRMLTPVLSVAFLASGVSLGYDIYVGGDIGDKTILLFLMAFNALLLAIFGDMVAKRR